MKKTFCLLLLFAFIYVNMQATNSMEMISTLTGDFDGAIFGWSIASLDFNGDGIKDLVVQEANWNPTESYDGFQCYGRIYFYWGGNDFDNIPDFAISGSADFILAGYECTVHNAGDINNDGIEDLALGCKMGLYYKLLIYYGRPQPIDIPDVVFELPTSIYGPYRIRPLGDINADGYDDIGFTTGNSQHRIIKIILGGSFQTYDLYDLLYYDDSIMISGIGDVNGDGISDYHIKKPLYSTVLFQNILSVHFGSSNFPVLDSVVICPNTNSFIQDKGAAIGDVNGDGIGDFISYIYSEAKVWFGGPNITTQWDTVLTESVYTEVGEIVSYGDFNNDGYDDIVGSGPGYGWDRGISRIWLGGYNFNGTLDLVIPSPTADLQRFGFARATGDFNNDGYCDIAISQPYDVGGILLTPGRVYVFAGNPQLLDTTYANDDNTIPVPANSLWEINIYPNPLPKNKVNLNINFLGEGYQKTTANLKAVLYNIKGQKIESFNIAREDIQNRNWSGVIKNCPAGNYLIAIKDKNTNLITKQIIIK